MRQKVLLVVITAVITAMALFGLELLTSDRGGILASPANAQNIATGHFYTITQDTFIISASSGGDEVFVYYFDAKPEEEQSTISFITKAKAK